MCKLSVRNFTHEHFSMSIAKQVSEFTSTGTDPDTVGVDFKKYRDLGTKKLYKKTKKTRQLKSEPNTEILSQLVPLPQLAPLVVVVHVQN
jgi:hypothetical protein